MTTVVATPGQGSDRPQEVSYTDTKVIGNGSFGVVYQAKLCETNELVAIKKVLQDKRFKVSSLLLDMVLLLAMQLLCVNTITCCHRPHSWFNPNADAACEQGVMLTITITPCPVKSLLMLRPPSCNLEF